MLKTLSAILKCVDPGGGGRQILKTISEISLTFE